MVIKDYYVDLEADDYTKALLYFFCLCVMPSAINLMFIKYEPLYMSLFFFFLSLVFIIWSDYVNLLFLYLKNKINNIQS